MGIQGEARYSDPRRPRTCAMHRTQARICRGLVSLRSEREEIAPRTGAFCGRESSPASDEPDRSAEVSNDGVTRPRLPVSIHYPAQNVGDRMCILERLSGFA